MAKKKNQHPKTKDNLADIVRKSMIGKQQIPSVLKRGDNFCISGLLINHFAPDIDIECETWSGITQFVNRYPKYFSEESYYSSYGGNDLVEKYVYDFKQYYKKTKRINLKLLAHINDQGFGNSKPFTFTDFANLFQEIGIKIERLNPITEYKEDNVLTVDNVQLIDNKPIPTSLDSIVSDPFSHTNINIENMHVQLDPNIVSNLMSKYVTEMLSKQRIAEGTTKSFRTMIKTIDSDTTIK